MDSTEAKDKEWQWHQLGHMQVCTSLQTDNHDSTPPLTFLQARCPSCRPTNSITMNKMQATKLNFPTLTSNKGKEVQRLDFNEGTDKLKLETGLPVAIGWLNFMRCPAVRPEQNDAIKQRFHIDGVVR